MGPIAEICEAVSPTFSLSLSEPRLGQQILTSDWSETRNSRNRLTDTEERETEAKRTTEI